MVSKIVMTVCCVAMLASLAQATSLTPPVIKTQDGKGCKDALTATIDVILKGLDTCKSSPGAQLALELRLVFDGLIRILLNVVIDLILKLKTIVKVVINAVSDFIAVILAMVSLVIDVILNGVDFDNCRKKCQSLHDDYVNNKCTSYGKVDGFDVILKIFINLSGVVLKILISIVIRVSLSVSLSIG